MEDSIQALDRGAFRLETDMDDMSVEKKSRTAQSVAADTDALELVQSHISNHDMPGVPVTFTESNAEQYLRFSPTRKIIIVIVLSFCSFLAPIGSTSILPAIPEVAQTYSTSGSVVNVSNALYLAFMGVAAPFWGPFSQVWGRRPVCSGKLLSSYGFYNGR